MTGPRVNDAVAGTGGRLGCVIDVTDTVFIVRWYDEPDDPRGYALEGWERIIMSRSRPNGNPLNELLISLMTRKSTFVFQDPHLLRGDTEVFRHQMVLGLHEQGLKVYRDDRDHGLWFSIEDNCSENMVLIEWEALKALSIVIGDQRDRAAAEVMAATEDR